MLQSSLLSFLLALFFAVLFFVFFVFASSFSPSFSVESTSRLTNPSSELPTKNCEFTSIVRQLLHSVLPSSFSPTAPEA